MNFQPVNVVNLTKDQKVLEYVKCKNNFLYFLHNYVYIPESGGSILYSPQLLHPNFKKTIQCSLKFGKAILMASRQLGKALSIYTPIPLSNGKFIPMNDIKAGDLVISPSGNAIEVNAVTPIMYNHKCYRIYFNGADPIVADANHLWKITFKPFKIFNQIIKTSKLKIFSDSIAADGYNRPFIEHLDNRYYITHIEEIESVPVKCISVNSKDGMFLCGQNKIPTHNSTISAVLIEWMLNFFPRNRAVIINMSKTAGQENIDKIRFIHDSLPDFLKSPHKNRAVERKTYLEYSNDSKVVVFYPSSSTSPNTLGRSLTAPVLYIDECSFIRHIDDAYSSAQPILSKAREQAKKYGYPTLLLVTATPNGIQGDGHFFFKMWSNAVSTEELYDEDDKLISECENVIADPTRNGFVAVKYHWSEDPTKDQNWYLRQCQD